MCQCFPIQEISNYVENVTGLGNLVFHNIMCKFYFNLSSILTLRNFVDVTREIINLNSMFNCKY